MSDYAEIIAMLEKATGPDRKIDNAIEAAIDYPKPPRFTGVFEDALTLIPEGWWLDVLCQFPTEPSTWRATLSSKGAGYYAAPQFTVDSCGATGADVTAPAIALCIAALKARAAIPVAHENKAP